MYYGHGAYLYKLEIAKTVKYPVHITYVYSNRLELSFHSRWLLELGYTQKEEELYQYLFSSILVDPLRSKSQGESFQILIAELRLNQKHEALKNLRISNFYSCTKDFAAGSHEQTFKLYFIWIKKLMD